MSYILGRALVIFSFLTFLSPIIAKAQGPDTVYKVPFTPFLAQLIAFKELNVKIELSQETKLIPVEHSIIAPNGQQLFKNGKEIYVIIEQTGFLYHLTSHDSTSCVFTRIDHTVNLNYNINCTNLIYHNQFYSYGGYGFWKTNGQLRKFNVEDSEWDIIPLDKEIIATNYIWFDEAQGKLYTPIQRIVNAGIAGPENVKGVTLCTSYYLDLNKHEWTKLGVLSSPVAQLIKDDYNSENFLNTKEGLLHLTHDDLYYFDFVHNKVYKSKNADLNQFLIRRASLLNIFLYKGYIHAYSTATKSFTQYPFKITDFVLLNNSIWETDHEIYYIIIGILLLILLLVFGIWFFNKSVKRKLEIAQLKMLKTKTVNQAFTGTEVALIQLLLAASLNENTVDIHQINHVLGIKEKNIGLQKKVRSDVINAINDKYEFISQSSEVLIGSSRKVDDKRFYEYFITKSEIKSAQRILENN